jgi:hypothetical protein
MFKYLALSLTLLVTVVACVKQPANSFINSRLNTRSTKPQDIVAQLLDNQTKSIFEVKQQLKKNGYQQETMIVGNRGMHNPEGGSFSFFETYHLPNQTPNLFIGFFSERQGDDLSVLTDPAGGLLIELIAFDPQKQLYNFWEMIGDKGQIKWFYRGDSMDVLADTQGLYLQPTGFGDRLRCSGCHTLGGPILKELAAPHTDWWQASNPLPLGTLQFSSATPEKQLASVLFKQVSDASVLAKAVTRSFKTQSDYLKQTDIKRLASAPLEINLTGDLTPQSPQIAIPAEFFVDPLLTGPQGPVLVSRAHYQQAIAELGQTFAGDEVNGLTDSAQAFHIPIRSVLQTQLLQTQLTTANRQMILNQLALDFGNPLFSPERLASLKTSRPISSRQTVSQITPLDYLNNLKKQSNSYPIVKGWVVLAAQRRLELAQSQLSSNPRGQILEPGFRVVFPSIKQALKPFQYQLDKTTGALVQRLR